MKDALDELAAKLMDDAADTTDKFRLLASDAGWSTDEALRKLVEMFRRLAKSRREG